ncbi:MAG: sulfotransferase domain-containing protein [Cyanobacteria bacterium P01_D01_bin.1]
MNIYHCCAPKTASQWIKAILSDPAVLEGTDLSISDYYREVMLPRISLQKDTFDTTPPPPCNAILTPVYEPYEGFQKIPKQNDYRVFAIIRDPRDIIISWYFSVKLTHEPSSIGVRSHRKSLRELPLYDGLLYSINNCLRPLRIISSWKKAEETNPEVKVFRYEDLTQRDNVQVFKQLFDHCGLSKSEESLQDILKRYSFESLTSRAAGQTDFSSHLRKGVAGDWANYFTREIQQEFSRVHGDLPAALGYQSTEDYLLERQYDSIQSKMNVMQSDLTKIEKDYDAYAQMQQDLQQFNQQVRKKWNAKGHAQHYTQTLQQTQTESTMANWPRIEEIVQHYSQLEHDLTIQQALAEQCQTRIAAMESSKFWKLRSHWIKAKRRLGLTRPDE